MSDNDTTEYEYRIVLESSSGIKLPLLSQDNDLHTTQQRLMDILLNTDYAKGWIERRPLGAWEMILFKSREGMKQIAVQHTRGCIAGDIDSECSCEQEVTMTNEEKITALTNAACDAYHTTARFAYLAYVQRLRNRFQQWGNTASGTLLSHLENNGYTIAKIEQRSDDERESSAVVVGAEETGAGEDTEA